MLTALKRNIYSRFHSCIHLHFFKVDPQNPNFGSFKECTIKRTGIAKNLVYQKILFQTDIFNFQTSILFRVTELLRYLCTFVPHMFNLSSAGHRWRAKWNNANMIKEPIWHTDRVRLCSIHMHRHCMSIKTGNLFFYVGCWWNEYLVNK